MSAQPLPLASAMILAAGRGERMRPLTDHTPKPLLTVQGKPLLEWHLQALIQARLPKALINTGWLGGEIPALFQQQYRDHRGTIELCYSREDLDFGGGIETAGGIARALPQLEDPFWLIAGDVFTPEFVIDEAMRQSMTESDALAHLWLVPNPQHHPQGDFTVGTTGQVSTIQANRTTPIRSFTYSTIAILKHALFAPPWSNIPKGNPEGIAAPLGPLLKKAADAGKVTASIYEGAWTDVGTPERLEALNSLVG